MKNTFPEYLTFDDVLIQPAYSEILPAEVKVDAVLTRKIKLELPLLSAAMDTVTESKLAISLGKLGGLGIIHKNMAVEKQAGEVAKVAAQKLLAAGAVGASGDYFERARALVSAGAKVIVVDTAHGHSVRVIEAVRQIKKQLKGAEVIAGNIATAKAAHDLIRAGADALKVGIGPGSICTTRIVAGIGVPQLSAIMEVAAAARPKKIPVIADGGIKYSGDAVKALAAGADTVMVGSLLAGTEEAPGGIFEQNGKKYKSYRGMGSLAAMQKGSKDRYGQEGLAVSKLVPEGIEGAVCYKGPMADIVMQLAGGLKSGMGYVGAKNISELQKKARFIRITAAGLKESHPHDVQITKKAPNY